MKYILRIKTYFGVIAHVLDNEEDALAKLRHWQKHPVFMGGTVQAVGTVSVPYAVTVAEVKA